jgi:hypothetical protein
MTRYQQRVLFLAMYWLVVVVTVSLAWEVSSRTVFMACIAGSIGGFAIAVPDLKSLPTRIVVSRVLLTQSGVDGLLLGRCISLLILMNCDENISGEPGQSSGQLTLPLIGIPVRRA